jgi:hypothetical protein
VPRLAPSVSAPSGITGTPDPQPRKVALQPDMNKATAQEVRTSALVFLSSARNAWVRTTADLSPQNSTSLSEKIPVGLAIGDRGVLA